MENERHTVLLYYRYVRLEDPERFATEHRRPAFARNAWNAVSLPKPQ